jgi:carboxypeptidase family protein
MTLRRVAAVMCLALSGCAGLIAQTVTGSLIGIVVDPSGSAIPDIKLQLTNQGTSATSQAMADSSGIFRFANLLPATYSVSVQAKRFKTRIIRDVAIGVRPRAAPRIRAVTISFAST